MARVILALFLGLSAQAVFAETLINVNNATLAELKAQGVQIIDIRTPREWRETGVIEGSHLVTFFDEQGRYDFPAWLATLNQIVDPNEPFVLICRTGSRTGLVGRALAEQLNRPGVHHARDGIRQWMRAGYPVTAPAR